MSDHTIFRIPLFGKPNGPQSPSVVLGFALVDEADYHQMKATRWNISKAGYAAGRTGPPGARSESVQLMHREIMGSPKGFHVDHINGDKLDNRRANLRVCTCAENLRNRTKLNRNNTSGFRGVYHNPRSKVNPWRAMITLDRKLRDLGGFATTEEAARAYDEAARVLYGEFASLNFPEEALGLTPDLSGEVMP